MSKKATNDLMDELHGITAAKLTEIIRNGVETFDKEGNSYFQPASPAYIAAAIKFLKDNDITADPTSPRMGDLNNAMGDIPTFDDDDDWDEDERPIAH